MTEPERRQTPRAALRLMVFVKFVSTGRILRALTKDIGDRGACLLTDETIAPGTKLELEIVLPDRPTPVACSGDVLWHRTVNQPDAPEHGKVETGVAFATIAPKDKALLLQFARLNAPPPPM